MLIVFLCALVSCLHGSPWKGIGFWSYSCEPPCVCWGLNQRPLEEQSVFLTAEPSLQPWLIVLLALINSPAPPCPLSALWVSSTLHTHRGLRTLCGNSCHHGCSHSVPETSSSELDSLRKPHCKRSSRLRRPHNCKDTDCRSRAKMILGCR